jgi:hypothetical protein
VEGLQETDIRSQESGGASSNWVKKETVRSFLDTAAFFFALLLSSLFLEKSDFQKTLEGL